MSNTCTVPGGPKVVQSAALLSAGSRSKPARTIVSTCGGDSSLKLASNGSNELRLAVVSLLSGSFSPKDRFTSLFKSGSRRSAVGSGVHGDVGIRLIVLASSEEHAGLAPVLMQAFSRDGVLGLELIGRRIGDGGLGSGGLGAGELHIGSPRVIGVRGTDVHSLSTASPRASEPDRSLVSVRGPPSLIFPGDFWSGPLKVFCGETADFGNTVTSGLTSDCSTVFCSVVRTLSGMSAEAMVSRLAEHAMSSNILSVVW